MILLLLVVISHSELVVSRTRDSRRHSNINSFMANLPSLSLGYISELAIPSMKLPPSINPSKILGTKVIKIVTTYVYQNPVCMKISGKKPLCRKENSNQTTNLKYQNSIDELNLDHNDPTVINDKNYKSSTKNDLGIYVEGSEYTGLGSHHYNTPELSSINELLIEDRLNDLEVILPHYKRRRIYETSTLTVTRVKHDNKITATLLVKNCVPQGYPLCPTKPKKRKSKMEEWTQK
ncbi:hypothetical protein WA026_006637 [Henosepilachna vigintioctopunctata]|uniref:Uncharacterized protein n=1 Tax=Henosepilachna vigintioctopunctata TaxID=420089 RepID=A0AAW1UJJ2_9CUCU